MVERPDPGELILKLFISRFASWLQLRSYGYLLAFMLLVSGCSPGIGIYDGSPAPTTPLPSLTTQASIEVVYPLPLNELIGGQAVRVTLTITGEGGSSVEGAAVQVDLLSPDGSLYTALAGVDQGKGRYQTDPINLPLRDAAGTWLVQARVEREDGQILETTSRFNVRQSFSEGLEELYGFWIALPTPPFAYTGPSFADPKLKFHPYQDGGGYVILTNLPASGSVAEFSMLDIHWRPVIFPENQQDALAYINDLAGPHGMTVSYTDLEAEESSFLGRPAWLVSGRWVEPLNSIGHPDSSTYPAEWIIFNCPGSDFSWTLLITSQKSSNIAELRSVLDTFQCPVSD